MNPPLSLESWLDLYQGTSPLPRQTAEDAPSPRLVAPRTPPFVAYRVKAPPRRTTRVALRAVPA